MLTTAAARDECILHRADFAPDMALLLAREIGSRFKLAKRLFVRVHRGSELVGRCACGLGAAAGVHRVNGPNPNTVCHAIRGNIHQKRCMSTIIFEMVDPVHGNAVDRHEVVAFKFVFDAFAVAYLVFANPVFVRDCFENP